MKGICRIKGVSKEFPCVTLIWDVKGVRKKQNRISAFKIYFSKEDADDLMRPTRVKLDLLVSNLLRFVKIKQIKTELDLEIFVNQFMMEYSPALLFELKRHFKCVHMDNEDVTEPRGELVTDKYIKQKYKERVHETIREFGGYDE